MSITIIGEIGINHNGDLEICKRLIDNAVSVGFDAIKFQKRNIDKVYNKELLDSPRESPWGSTQRHQKEGLEFGLNEYQEIDAYCKKKKIRWFASAWDLDSQLFLKQFDLPFNKIASAMIVYSDLLIEVAKEKKRTFISTGMSELSDIDNAVEIFKKYDCDFELMHTVSTYPMKDEHANLSMIQTLKDRYNCNVGYSGHENGVLISQASVMFGITSLERHITLDRTMYGSDQSASIELNGMRLLVEGVRKLENVVGDGRKKILEEELPIAKKLREHLV
jgi:N-acetylneuraminate synthase